MNGREAMETAVRTPMDIFHLPQRLVVPLFQRQYVWDETEQWLPLWQDVRRVAELRLKDPASTAAHRSARMRRLISRTSSTERVRKVTPT